MRNSVLQSLVGHWVPRLNRGSMLILAMLMALMPLALSTRVNAQTISAVLSGHVIDKTQGVVPNASVRLVEQNTKFTTLGSTNTYGDFSFTNVQPGTYTVIVTAPGYKEMRKVGIVMHAQENISAGTLTLEVGAETQSVVVAADITPLQSGSSERSGTIDETQIDNLLSIGRDPMAFLSVLPGVAPGSGNTATLAVESTPSVNGYRQEFTLIQVDGAVSNVRESSDFDTPIDLDAIKEISVMQSNFQAQYGQTGGLHLNLVTKNGTQDFHGGLFYYFRNEDLNANSWNNKYNNQTRPRYRYNTAGGTVGGPVYWPHHFNANKNKLFFFVDYEDSPIKSPIGLEKYRIPTQAEINGDFSATYKPGTISSQQNASTLVRIKDPTSSGTCATYSATAGAGCFPGNVIPSGRIIGQGQDFLKLAYNVTIGKFPSRAYNNVDISHNNYNYIVNESRDQSNHQYVFRVDYAPTDKLHMYLRGEQSMMNYEYYDWTFRQNDPSTTPNFVYNATYTITPTLVNEFKADVVGYTEGHGFSQSDLSNFLLGSNGINLPSLYSGVNPLNLLPNFSLGVGSAPGISWDYRFPMSNYTRGVAFSDNITKIYGRHTFKVGIDITKDIHAQTAHNRVGTYNFSQDSSDANDSNFGFSNAQLGVLDTYSQYTKLVSYDPTTLTAEWYYQDTWKVTPKLLLDFGIRNSFDMAETVKAGNNWAASLYNASNAPTLYKYASDGKALNPITGTEAPAAYVGQYVTGSGTVDNGALYMNSGKSGYPKYGVFGDGILIAPRVGFSWDIMPKTILRGGFGLYYNTRLDYQGNFAMNAPSTMSTTQYYSSIDSTASNYYMNMGSLSGPYSISHALDINAKVPYSYDMSLGVQRQLPTGIVLDVAYVGNLSRHLATIKNINKVPYGAEFNYANQYSYTDSSNNTHTGTYSDNFFRPYPGLGTINMQYNSMTANYNSLQVKLTRRFHNGLEYGVAYTWSHALDYADYNSSSIPTYQNVRKWDYAASATDLRHNLVIDYVYHLPKVSSAFGQDSNWNNLLTRAVFDNWQINGMVSRVTGFPDNIGVYIDSGANIAGGGDGARVVQTCDPWRTKIKHVSRTYSQWFNTGCFVPPLQGSKGTALNPAGTQMSWGIGQPMPRTNIYYPAHTNFNTALFRDFPIKEKLKFQLRVETYNTFNHTQWNGVDDEAEFATATSQNLSSNPQENTTFGQLNSASSPRYVQLAARFNF